MSVTSQVYGLFLYCGCDTLSDVAEYLVVCIYVWGHNDDVDDHYNDSRVSRKVVVMMQSMVTWGIAATLWIVA